MTNKHGQSTHILRRQADGSDLITTLPINGHSLLMQKFGDTNALFNPMWLFPPAEMYMRKRSGVSACDRHTDP